MLPVATASSRNMTPIKELGEVGTWKPYRNNSTASQLRSLLPESGCQSTAGEQFIKLELIGKCVLENTGPDFA